MVVFDSFGLDDSFNSSHSAVAAWNISEPFSSGNTGVGLAARFSVQGASCSLDAVTLALGYMQDTSQMMLSILRDDNGRPTGDLLETITLNLSAISNLVQIATITSSLHPVLATGEAFWLVLEPPAQNLASGDNNSAYYWYDGEMIGAYTFRNFDFESSHWENWMVLPPVNLPAFRIEGTPVPEPASIWLLLVGLVTCAYQRRWIRVGMTN